MNNFLSIFKKVFSACIFFLFLFVIPRFTEATSMFYVISPAEGSNYLHEFRIDNPQNGEINVTRSVELVLNGESPNFFTNALAFNPEGELYAWAAKNTLNNTDYGQLYKINRFSGEITLIGDNYPWDIWVNGLAFDASGKLFGLASYLYEIDPLTGIRTQIGTEPITGGHRGLAINFENDQLYAWMGLDTIDDHVLKINKDNASTELINLNFNIPYKSVGTEFDPETGALISIRGGSLVYSADLNTGNGSLLGTLMLDGNPVTSNSLAVLSVPAPEPSTIILFGSALFGLTAFRKKF